jgi:2-dehydropantoate 2-reductase
MRPAGIALEPAMRPVALVIWVIRSPPAPPRADCRFDTVNRMPDCRIAVIGPGAIGAVFAAAAQQAGPGQIVICGRRPLEELVVCPDGQQPIAIDAPVITDPRQVAGPADWVFLAVKAHQTQGASGWLRALAGPETVVVVLQNGVEHYQRVTPLAGQATVLPAIVWCPAETVAAGRVRLRGEPRLSVPAGEPGQRLARMLDGAARVDLAPDFTTEAWRKLCVNVVAGLMALAGRRAGIFRQPEMAALARALAAECSAVAQAEGAQLDDGTVDEIVAHFTAMPADLGTSILADREAGRPLEWDARNGVVRRLGIRHGIPTPVSDVIVPLLAAASGDPQG